MEKVNALFVTLADENYIEQAKQLFSSAYWNAGWKGDYMLLSHEIPEKKLKWFRDKGILVKKVKALYKSQPGGMNPVLESKFYLFTPEFKKWGVIIYSDADALVRASLNDLLFAHGFHAVIDTSSVIKKQILSKEKMHERKLDEGRCYSLISEIKKFYGLRSKAFCAGFFVFNTSVINEKTFLGLKNIMDKYQNISEYGDQLSFNLYFYNKWKRLPLIYNIQVSGEKNRWLLKPEKVRGAILHFIGKEKPWISRNYFYKEWEENLKKADLINLKKIQAGKIFKNGKRYCTYLNIREKFCIAYLWADKEIGQIGLLLKKYFPRLYNLVKNHRPKARGMFNPTVVFEHAPNSIC